MVVGLGEYGDGSGEKALSSEPLSSEKSVVDGDVDQPKKEPSLFEAGDLGRGLLTSALLSGGAASCRDRGCGRACAAAAAAVVIVAGFVMERGDTAAVARTPVSNGSMCKCGGVGLRANSDMLLL